MRPCLILAGALALLAVACAMPAAPLASPAGRLARPSPGAIAPVQVARFSWDIAAFPLPIDPADPADLVTGLCGDDPKLKMAGRIARPVEIAPGRWRIRACVGQQVGSATAIVHDLHLRLRFTDEPAELIVFVAERADLSGGYRFEVVIERPTLDGLEAFVAFNMTPGRVY